MLEPAGAETAKTVVVPQEQAVINVVKNVGPAVVSVMVKDRVRGYDFFYGAVDQQREGLGSGFIFDQRGYVLTNNHVVEGADEIKVVLTDGREFTAEIAGTDPSNDIAVLKLEIKGATLPIVALGDSSKLQVGQTAIAIGTPYDMEFQNSVTVGVVSALGRNLQTESRNAQSVIPGVVQTDASINPGNSGGPLLNTQGQVIGINTAILGSAQGMGFAIPINTAKEIVNDLITYGFVKRPYIGIYGQSIGKEALAEYFNYTGEGGIWIAQVVAGSPADRAGLRAGDVILEIDREKVMDMDQLKTLLSAKGIGKDVKVLTITKKGLQVITVKVGESPAPSKAKS
jgi:serine protease Do